MLSGRKNPEKGLSELVNLRLSPIWPLGFANEGLAGSYAQKLGIDCLTLLPAGRITVIQNVHFLLGIQSWQKH